MASACLHAPLARLHPRNERPCISTYRLGAPHSPNGMVPRIVPCERGLLVAVRASEPVCRQLVLQWNRGHRRLGRLHSGDAAVFHGYPRSGEHLGLAQPFSTSSHHEASSDRRACGSRPGCARRRPARTTVHWDLAGYAIPRALACTATDPLRVTATAAGRDPPSIAAA